MYILTFDTSNRALAVALFEDDNLLGQVTINIKKNHSISLMPTIDYLVSTCDLTPADLDRIVVAEGPGSYTGLRMAVATAKTLAYSRAIDLVGVSSLQALTDLSVPGLVVPLMDARRNNVYVGFYENGHAVMPDRHASLAEVMDLVKDYDQVTFVGEVANFIEQIKACLPDSNYQETLPSASLLAKVGQNLEPVDVHTFIPKYLKKVEAEENWLTKNQETNADNYIKLV